MSQSTYLHLLGIPRTLAISVMASLTALTSVCTSQPLMSPSWDLLQDADQDGMTDADEILWEMDPLDPTDGTSDLDGDELSFAWEYELGTDPSLADTDADGWRDSDELLLYGTDPLSAASFPLAGPSQNSTDVATESLVPEESTPTTTYTPPPPPSLSNGDFTDVSITTWKSMVTSKEYQNKGFVWGAGAVTSWSAYVGTTVEVWD